MDCMAYKTMEVYNDVFLEEGSRKVIRFFIIPEPGEEHRAIQKLSYAVMNYYLQKGVMFKLFREDRNPYVQLLVEGLED